MKVKWSVLRQNSNTVLESIYAYYSALLWSGHNATLLQAEPSESSSVMNWCIALDGCYSSCPQNGHYPTHCLFFCLPSICLKTMAASPHFFHPGPSLRELEMTNRRYHWEDADTAGPSKRPPPDGPDRLLKRSLRPAGHLQWLSRSCRRLIDNDQYGGTEQNKMKINITVSLTGLGLHRDEFRSQVLVLRHPWARHLFYFNHFTCFGQPTKVALHNNLWSDTRGPNLIP